MKSVGGQEAKKEEIDPVRRFGQTTNGSACPENEAFLKMVEDPMVYIKQKELEARHAVFENPLRMKQIRDEIEALKQSKKKKKEKKHKKHHKKHHKRHKVIESRCMIGREGVRSSSSSSSSRSSRSASKDRKRRSRSRSHKKERRHRSRSEDSRERRHRRDHSLSKRD